MSWRRFLMVCLAVALSSGTMTLSAAGPAVAQFPDDGELGPAGVAVDLSKPFYESGGFGATTSVLYVSGRLPVGSATLVAGLGLSRAAIDGSSNTVLGNPRIGFIAGQADGLQLELAGTLPLATAIEGDDDYAVGTAYLADVERPENFLEDAASLSAQLSRVWAGGDTEPQWRVRGGVVALFATEGSGETETFARYGASTRIPFDRTTLRFELGGIAWLSQGNLSLSERTIHTVGAALALRRDGGAIPELYVRLPLDSDLSEDLDAVVGMRILLQ